ncbi:MAG: chemotaxis-specific protein-glutamate methyltransferase CheB [Isosphaeraceae bacterium]|nr:chemotaxis-specific protein-glutamate methyltransferase CheB [Isosphaeraceae bacterium]
MSRLAPPRTFDILVVDDSEVVRQMLRAIIEEEPAFRVLVAGDPYEAVALMSRTAPAAIVLDIDMPRMDGLTFLRKLMRQHPLPVLLCTDHVQRGLSGLELGALEVLGKPDWGEPHGLVAWGARLREGLRDAVGLSRDREESSRSSEARHSADVILPRMPYAPRGAGGERLIAIGASTGGIQAIKRLLAGLPPQGPGVVIVQHMPRGFTAAFADRLNKDGEIPLPVIEARPNELIRPGMALVVPGHAHGLVRRVGGGYRVELVDGPPVCRHRPSVDVLFRSVAQAAGPWAAGVLLTGMGDDGARGLLEMHEAGAWTIAQDEATSIVFGMPREAIRRGAARQVLPLDRIPAALARWAGIPQPG